MAELVSTAPTDPVRICPACGDVLVSGACAACAPPPARAYSERTSLPMHSAKGLVDSRRAAAEWSVSPEELDPHTRKAHPSQLRSARRDYDLPEPAPRGRRQTQVYRKGGGAPLAAPIPAPARSWALPEPRPEPNAEPHAKPLAASPTPSAPEPDQPQTASTARHARPVSPFRPASGPVSLPVPVSSPAPPEVTFQAERPEPEPFAALEDEPIHTRPTDDLDVETDTDLAPRTRGSLTGSRLAWIVLAGGAVLGVVAALV